jgi:hypothetical protein
MQPRLVYALEELLTAARVPHHVTPTDSRRGWDLYYGEQAPEDEAVWMEAAAPAWRFFGSGGRVIRQTSVRSVMGEEVRLPEWDPTAALRPSVTAASRRPPIPDLASAAFYFLSRWEEWQAPERDRFGRFPLAASVFGQGLWSLEECPVEQYACVLRCALTAAATSAWIGEVDVYQASKTGIIAGGSFTVGLSHDVDTLRRWDARGFARSGVAAARGLLRGRPRAAARASLDLASGVRSRVRGVDPHCNLRAIVDQEQRAAARGTFFLLPRHTHPWDGTHPEHYQRLLPDAARYLGQTAEIGLHASTAAVNATELKTERARLEALVDGPIRGVRFHNLRGGYAALPEAAAAGLEYDSTVAFAEAPGFPAGLARPFRPYDRQRDRSLELVEVPLAVMDTTLLSGRYLGLEVAAGRERVLTVLEQVRRWNGAAALLWHNDNLPPNQAGGYGQLFFDVIDWVHAVGGRVGTLAEIVDDWKSIRGSLRRA